MSWSRTNGSAAASRSSNSRTGASRQRTSLQDEVNRLEVEGAGQGNLGQELTRERTEHDQTRRELAAERARAQELDDRVADLRAAGGRDSGNSGWFAFLVVTLLALAGAMLWRELWWRHRLPPPPMRVVGDGSTLADVRFVKGGVARAIRTLRAAASPATEDRVVPLSPKMVGLRFQAAARAAGVERVTAHSGRVGLASELTSRGASTTGRLPDRRAPRGVCDVDLDALDVKLPRGFGRD